MRPHKDHGLAAIHPSLVFGAVDESDLVRDFGDLDGPQGRRSHELGYKENVLHKFSHNRCDRAEGELTLGPSTYGVALQKIFTRARLAMASAPRHRLLPVRQS
jgi:hypothetical protein